LIRSHLVTAFEDGANLTARAHLQVAAMMGATAFQKGLGAMHAMSHPCGAILNTHHGLTNAVVMPYVLEFNRSAIAVEMAHLAQALDLPTPGLDGVIQWVLQLRETLAIPKTLSEIGVRYEHIEQLAPMALGDPSGNTNPVSLSLASVRQLFGQAISGPVS
ncbi:MAG: iron-containing alcohol dehydrogenase, partial [Chromatiales bacterium]|nr:iron-containing alcohol dehydrogenase [Chromatiales bacterium]